MSLPSPQAGKSRKGKTTAVDICIMALSGVLLYVLQVALGFMPNIEPVSLLIILFTLVFKRRIIGILAVFILLEGLTYGFGTWWFMYLYVWPILAFVTHLFRRMESSLGWAILSAAFGLAFGFMCSWVYFVIGGTGGGIAYFLSGMMFDIVHCAGNFVLMLLLYKKLRGLLERLDSKIHT